MLNLDSIQKKYKDNLILADITFQITNPGLYVLHGINGSGKSTIIKIITGIIYKSAGSITHNLNISYLPDKFSMPKLMKAKSYLKYVIDLKSSEYDKYLSEYQIPNKRIGDLSKGNQQKLGLLQILSKNADCYILDEPIDGLDDYAKKLFKSKIIHLIQNDKIVILSLHNKTFLN